MTAKDYLRRIRQLDDAASAAQLELERVESTVTRVTACHKRFFAGKGTDDADRMANAVERLQRARERGDTSPTSRWTGLRRCCTTRRGRLPISMAER